MLARPASVAFAFSAVFLTRQRIISFSFGGGGGKGEMQPDRVGRKQIEEKDHGWSDDPTEAIQIRKDPK